MARVDGTRIAEALIHVADVIESNKDYLCALDGEVGDGDHGVSMTIGMRTARKALQSLNAPTPAQAFQTVSDAFADEVGAASGVLYEMAFAAAAKAAQGKLSLDASVDWAYIFEAMASEMQRVGKAELGDKTLLDAWFPAAQAVRAAAQRGEPLGTALNSAVEAAWRGVEQTKDLVPKRGRASRLGERARGHQDAGATSAWLIIKALADRLAD
ncbi:MAG: dihydroxyacetone kinase subunit DhaL [Anaerolineae bacterium]|nr:dihydroxyacetone kinase subunit DhaL [Thermoflexales bacterium]MDW8395178.1 dihydroxyacetone kinase subunit DhaL [Anaerolineae bacterium]